MLNLTDISSIRDSKGRVGGNERAGVKLVDGDEINRGRMED